MIMEEISRELSKRATNGFHPSKNKIICVINQYCKQTMQCLDQSGVSVFMYQSTFYVRRNTQAA